MAMPKFNQKLAKDILKAKGSVDKEYAIEKFINVHLSAGRSKKDINEYLQNYSK